MATTKQLDFAGDYHLPYLHLINHMGEGVDPSSHGENIVHLMIEFNIYESVFDSSVTGSIVVVDTNNLISKLPIQGTERLSFILTTKLENETEDTEISLEEVSESENQEISADTDDTETSNS